MNGLKAWLFNRKASDMVSRPEEVIKSLGLGEGDNVVDLGSGGGYFTFRFAEVVGEKGVVYAVDTDLSLLDDIKRKASEKHAINVKAILDEELQTMIPDGCLDLVFLRNVYHHLSGEVEYFKDLSKKLKSAGRIAIVEYSKGGGFSFHRLFKHYTPREKIVEDLEKAGYEVLETHDFLKQQSYTIFRKKAADIQ